MAYTVLSKEGRKGNIVHFLADNDKDIVKIIDDCDPGSTIKVLKNVKEDKENIHTFMKAPSGRWVVSEGETDFKVPFNDVEVEVPKDTAKFSNKTAGELQENMKFYPTGLVTGTLKNAEYPEIYGADKKDQKGHFFCAILKPPQDAKNCELIIDGEKKKDMEPLDDWFMLCMENISMAENKTAQIKYDNGQSFTFDLDYVDLE